MHFGCEFFASYPACIQSFGLIRLFSFTDSGFTVHRVVSSLQHSKSRSQIRSQLPYRSSGLCGSGIVIIEPCYKRVVIIIVTGVVIRLYSLGIELDVELAEGDYLTVDRVV